MGASPENQAPAGKRPDRLQKLHLFYTFFLEILIVVPYIAPRQRPKCAQTCPGAPRGRLSRPIPAAKETHPPPPRDSSAKRRPAGSSRLHPCRPGRPAGAIRGPEPVLSLSKGPARKSFACDSGHRIVAPLCPGKQKRGGWRAYALFAEESQRERDSVGTPFAEESCGECGVAARPCPARPPLVPDAARSAVSGRSGDFAAQHGALSPGRAQVRKAGQTSVFLAHSPENGQRMAEQGRKDYYPCLTHFASQPA